MKNKDCFFYIEEKEGEKYISACCVECEEKKEKKSDWFWKGSEKGYGKLTINCSICKKQINQK